MFFDSVPQAHEVSSRVSNANARTGLGRPQDWGPGRRVLFMPKVAVVTVRGLKNRGLREYDLSLARPRYRSS